MYYFNIQGNTFMRLFYFMYSSLQMSNVKTITMMWVQVSLVFVWSLVNISCTFLKYLWHYFNKVGVYYCLIELRRKQNIHIPIFEGMTPG